MTRRFAWLAIVFLLWMTAAVRFHDLTRLPAGFNGEELDTLRVSETVRSGRLGVFYDVQKPAFSGREGLFPGIETLVTDVLGDGFLIYRMLPALGGLLAVALVYGAARRLMGVGGGLIAAFAMAFGVLPLLLSRLIIAQSLLLPLAALLLWLVLLALHIKRSGVAPLRLRTIPFTLIGVCLSVAAYTHWIGLLLSLLFVVYTVYLWRTRQPVSRRLLNYGGYAFLVSLILSIPYITTTFRVIGLSGIAAIWKQRPATVGMLLTNTRDLLVSLLGGTDLSLLLLIPVGLLFLSGLVIAVRRWREPGKGLVLLALGIGLLPAVWTGRGDYNLALAIPATAILIGLGGQWLWDGLQTIPTRRRVPTLALASLLVVILTIGVAWVLFDQWATDPVQARQYRTDWGQLALFLNSDTDPTPILICTDNLLGTSDQPLSDPTLLLIMIHRDKNNLRFSDCQTAVVLANGGQPERVIFSAQMDSSGVPQIPGALQRWLTPHPMLIAVPNAEHLVMTTLSVEQPLADTIGRLALSPASWTIDTPDNRDPAPLPVRMGDYLNFEGYDLAPARLYKPGDFIDLTTYWRIDGAQQADIHVFAHLVINSDDPPLIQNDMFDVLPSFLHERDIVVQSQAIQVPYPFPAGLYWLSVGAYHTETQTRVPFFDANNQIRTDRLFLGTIQIDG